MLMRTRAIWHACKKSNAKTLKKFYACGGKKSNFILDIVLKFDIIKNFGLPAYFCYFHSVAKRLTPILKNFFFLYLYAKAAQNKTFSGPAHACEKEFFYVKFATPKQQ